MIAKKCNTARTDFVRLQVEILEIRKPIQRLSESVHPTVAYPVAVEVGIPLESGHGVRVK